MPAPIQCFYALVARKNSNLFKAASRKLLQVFKVFANQVAAVARPECRVYAFADGSIDATARDEIVRRGRSSRYTIDVFCESAVIKSTIEALFRSEGIGGATTWLIGPPPDDYGVIWAQIALLHSLRLVVAPTEGWSNNQLILEMLDRVEQECRQRPGEDDQPAPQFDSMVAMVEEIRKECAGALVLTDAAIRSAAGCQSRSFVGRAHALLVALSEIAGATTLEVGRSIGQHLTERGFDYKRSDAPEKNQALTATCCGKEILCGRHVRFGVHSGCVRVHFERCEGCAKFVIQHCGEHL